ncbi:PLP-dependent transferase [Clathrospora elynae]|uniref:PLP-dependent transferase n=1 Tax=Clathrospora elynae TaxID=706981 RepID=A0A6A5T0L5_9PLEO|nr:PLP-dependent transferase [Clathrospora elynae]
MVLAEVKTKDGVRYGKELREKEFLFEKGFLNLNHASFGTYPQSVRTTMRSFQDSCEARPDPFIIYDSPRYLDASRDAVAKLLNTPSSTLVFLPNATTGINTVLRNLIFHPGDHILIFSTIYGGCERTVAYITETTPAQCAKVEYIYPVEDDWLVSEFKAKVKDVEEKGGRVKIAIFDTVVSMPGVRMPFERLTETCKEMGVLSYIDGAHGVGQIELDLGRLDPDFFVSNCHKWLFTPRGCAIFHVPPRNQHLMRSTLPTSHGFIPTGYKPVSPFPKPSFSTFQAHSAGLLETSTSSEPSTISNKSAFVNTEKSAFIANFQFAGTIDKAPYLCVPAALQGRESMGGEEQILLYNQTLARAAGHHIARVLGTEVLENKTNTLGQCAMTNIRLPISLAKVEGVARSKGIAKEDIGVEVRDWMKRVSWEEYGTFVFVFWYGDKWWVRVSAQVYLEMGDFEWAAQMLGTMCERVEEGEWVGGESKK